MAPNVNLRTAPTKANEVAIAQAEAPELEYVNWWKDPGLRKLYFYAAIISVASATTGYDGSMLNNIRILPQWSDYFNDPQGSRVGLLTAMYSIGSIASLPIVPFVTDRFGRKSAIIIGCLFMVVAGAVQAAAKNLSMFEGARFFMGFGNSMAQLSSPLLLTELCHPQHRGKVTAIYNCLWNLGAIVNTWLTYGTKHIGSTWSWRIPTLGQAFPSVIQLAFIFFIPESPRWLISKDRTDKALNILGKYHANGNNNHPTVQFEYAEICETLRLEFLYKKSSTYLDFAKTKGNRYRFILIMSLGLFSQWSGNGLVSYYASELYDSVGVTSANTQLILNGSQTILSLIVSVSCAFLCDRVGRRPLFLAATTGMLIAFIAWTICSSQFQESGNVAAGHAVVAFIWIHGVCYALAWSGLLVAYTVEIMPFKIRAKGLMIMNFWVQVALVVNQYLNPIALKKLNPSYKFYIIYTCWIAFELVFVYFLYVETKGPTLEEIAKIFDGEDAEVGTVNLKETGIVGTRGSVGSATAPDPEKSGAYQTSSVEHRD